MVEWECVLKYFEDGVCEGVVFVCDYLICVMFYVFDDFVVSSVDCVVIEKVLGL